MQIASIQVLRAIAALLVLFAHLWTPFATSGVPDAFPNFIAGAAGVDLFFVISGFVMVYSSERLFAQPGGSVRFLLRRVTRIVPLYWATTTAVLLLMPFLHRTLESMDLTRRVVAASYLFIPYERPSGAIVPAHGVGWTLEYEMFFYLVFSLCVMLPRRAAVVAACGALIGTMFLATFIDLPRAVSYFATTFLWEFSYGMVIALIYRSGRRLDQRVAVGMVVAGALAYLCTCTQVIDADIAGRRYLLWGGSAAMVLAGCVLSKVQADAKRWAFLILIGEASYALYLTHSISLDLMVETVAKGLPGRHPYFFAAACIAIALGVAIAVHKGIERHVTRWLNARTDEFLSAHASSSTVIAEKSLP